MSVTLGRLGSDETYKVQFVDDLPEDKIILILRGGDCTAYVVDDYQIIDRNKKTGQEIYRYHIAPVSKMDRQHGFPQDHWMTADEILNNDDWKVLFLDSLADMADIKELWHYN